MNQTQIAAIIRVNDFRGLIDPPNFDETLNISWIGDSVKKNIWDNPNKSSVAAYTVSIFGDVKDHIDGSKIIDWFKESISKLAVRQACITINTSDGKTLSWHLDRDKAFR